MTKPFTLSVGLMLLVACGHDKKEATTLAISSIDSPASSPSAEPHLFTDKNGVIYLSWVEKIEGMHEFKYARLQDGQWSKPNRIASDSTWFVNWADYPMIATDGKGNFISHWLDKSGERTYEYDVKMSISSDSGNNWNSPFILHNDGKQAEHGFVTLVPYEDKVFVAWLDGRNTVMENMEGMEHHEGHHGAMSLRAAIIDYSGKKINEWELDNKTCDCCQTTAAITDNGPVVIYRDRSDEEIRDISIVRFVDGNWTKPQSIFNDNWKIAGCPVNGPSSASLGNSLVIAWFAAPDGKAQVNVIFSTDGGATFGKPVRVDEGNAIGRVDVTMLNNDNSMVSWMEGGAIKVVKVNRDGSKGTSISISNSSEARSSGFPQMTKSGNQLIFAWTDDKEKNIKVASIYLQ